MDAWDVARFWIKAKKLPGDDGCWEWQGGRLGNGYGQFKLDGKPRYAHRIAWELISGLSVPEGKNVCHRCDNRICVNPSHLFIATQQENVADAIIKGRREPIRRSRQGERSNWAKITEDDVREIRLMASRGYRQEDIAQQFGISRPAVSLIVNRKNWTHI